MDNRLIFLYNIIIARANLDLNIIPRVFFGKPLSYGK